MDPATLILFVQQVVFLISETVFHFTKQDLQSEQHDLVKLVSKNEISYLGSVTTVTKLNMMKSRGLLQKGDSTNLS